MSIIDPHTRQEIHLAQGVPDALWPSSNRFGIPDLLLDCQADAPEMPLDIWGAKRRDRTSGTALFYTDDYRFRNLWRNPDQLLRTNVTAFVEVNFSVYEDYPLALALWQTFRKRWLARYWQSKGLRCFVDLYVHPHFDHVNLLGVPEGWFSYATRGHPDLLPVLDSQLALARRHSGSDEPLFLVYGGGQHVRQWSLDNGCLWIVGEMDRNLDMHTEVLHGNLE